MSDLERPYARAYGAGVHDGWRKAWRLHVSTRLITKPYAWRLYVSTRLNTKPYAWKLHMCWRRLLATRWPSAAGGYPAAFVSPALLALRSYRCNMARPTRAARRVVVRIVTVTPFPARQAWRIRACAARSRAATRWRAVARRTSRTPRRQRRRRPLLLRPPSAPSRRRAS